MIPRMFHSAVTHNNQIIVFGGYTMGKSNKAKHQKLNDVYVLDMATLTGSVPKITGKPPYVVANHSAVVYNDVMYVYGGDSEVLYGEDDFRPTKGVDHHHWNCLDLRTFEWKSPPWKWGGRPWRRKEHSAVVIGYKMYVFGGIFIDDGTEAYPLSCSCTSWPKGGRCKHACKVQEETNELWAYDFKKEKWELLTQSGPTPRARNLHCAWGARGKMYVFGGGYDAGDGSLKHIMLDDLWEYDPEKNKWEMVNTSGTKPVGRSESACAVVNDRAIYIVCGYSESVYVAGQSVFGSRYFDGGLRLLCRNNHAPTWYNLNSPKSNKQPSPRAGCTLSINDEGSRAFLLGGYNGIFMRSGDWVYQDVWEMAVSKSEPVWSECSWCRSIGAWKHCSRCRVARFGSVNCQKKAWPTHKASCVPPAHKKVEGSE